MKFKQQLCLVGSILFCWEISSNGRPLGLIYFDSFIKKFDAAIVGRLVGYEVMSKPWEFSSRDEALCWVINNANEHYQPTEGGSQ